MLINGYKDLRHHGEDQLFGELLGLGILERY